MGGIITPKNTKSTSSVNLPSYITNAYQNVASMAGTAANVTPNYQGELSAPTSGLQAAAYAGLPGAVNSAQPYIDQAAGLTAQGTAPTSIMPYSPSALGQYMNPYTQSVIDATQNQFNLQNAQQQSSLIGNAASQHALGGDRSAVAAAQLAGQQQTAQAPVIAGLNQANFGQATQEFNTQQQTDLSNQQANAYRALYGAGEYGNLGQLTQGSQLAGLGAELTGGATQQQTQQNADTAAYQNYLLQLGYPLQAASSYGNIVSGLGSVYGGNKTTTQPGSSLLGQAAGLGLAGAGLGAFSSNTKLPLGGVFANGGMIGYADGGDTDDDEDGASDLASDYGESQEANSALGAIATGKPVTGVPHATPAQTTPAGIGTPSSGNPFGLDAAHSALLAAGLGAMSARGNPLSAVGQGGLEGLKAYQQQRQIEAQAEYRQAMSQAATTRSQALAQHYENADKKPVLIKGKTYQWYYPSDGSYHDTHIDNPEYLTGQTNAKLRQEALDRPDEMVVGADNSDPAHPKTVLIDRHKPGNRITVNASPGRNGAAGAGGVFGYKYQKAMENGMNAPDALEFASGRKQIDDKTVGSWAMRDATSQANAMNTAGSFETPAQYEAFRKNAYQNNLGILRGPASGGKVAPSGDGAAPKFVEGKVYVDKAGHKAKYTNGNWVNVP